MITYLNGEFLPHEDAKISVDDRAIMYGDSVFDLGRTFGGAPFRLDAHLERLRRSMRYVELDGDGMLPEIRDATHELLARNEHEIQRLGDVYFYHIVTRGPMVAPGQDPNLAGPTIIIKLQQVAFTSFAPYYRRGVDLHTSLLTTGFAGPLDPRLKGGNRLANTRAELKGGRMRHLGKGHWTIIFNPDGTVAEAHSANIVIVMDGAIVVPPRHHALGGISLLTVGDLAKELAIPIEERPVTTYDIINADEVFLTGSSYCLIPVVGLDGIPLREGRQVYSRILGAWKELVGMDFVAQAEDWASRSGTDTVQVGAGTSSG